LIEEGQSTNVQQSRGAFMKANPLTRKPKMKRSHEPGPPSALPLGILVIVCMTLLTVSPVLAGVQDTIQTNVPALKDVYANDFYIGCLLSYTHIGFSSDPYVSGQSSVVDTNGGYLIRYHMNSMGPGNNMKPQYTVDLSGSASAYNAATTQEAKDSINVHPIVRFNGNLIAQLNWALRQGFKVRGHTLVWHNQTPGTGFFREGYAAAGARLTKEVMAARLGNYIKEVMRLLHEGWAGLLVAMDVVNEAVNDDTGTDRSTNNEWYTTFGDIGYVMKAFELTRKYAVSYGETQIKLYYNDYNTHNANKANGIVRVCGPIFQAGYLDGIGMQEHDAVSSPTAAEWITSYTKFDAICSEMAVTEFDVKTPNFTPAGLASQANQVGALFKCFVERSYRSGRGKIVNVTKDGLNDRYTFNTNSSIFDSSDQCKPSFFAAVGVGMNFNMLKSLIAHADSLHADSYTPASWAALAAARNAAVNAMAQNYSATVSAADTLGQAKEALKAALDGLVPSVNAVVDGGSNPKTFALSQNYPNPFNPTTVVSYRLPVASSVRLAVYDLLGREAAMLVNERKASGTYTVTFDASGLASGVYFCRLSAGDFVETKALLLMK
jgi:endo-1,4-beta-xylanase